jgi:hypothetical protein
MEEQTLRESSAAEVGSATHQARKPKLNDDIARGVASAALTLQSVLLQALINEGVLTPAKVLEMIDKPIAAVDEHTTTEGEEAVAVTAEQCLEGVREGIASMIV